MNASKQETIELCSVGFTYSIENVLKEEKKNLYVFAFLLLRVNQSTLCIHKAVVCHFHEFIS